MKRLYTTWMALMIIGVSAAQEDKSNLNDDTTKIKLGNMTIIFGDGEEENFDFENEEEEEESKFNVIGEMAIGMNGWLTPSNNYVFDPQYENMSINYSRSRAFSANFMLQGLDLFKKRLYFTPGFGITWNNYHFKNNSVNIGTANDSTRFTIDSAIQYNKYKLRTTYIEVPLMIGARIGNVEKNHFTIEGGVIGGLNISSIVKEKFEVEGIKNKNKVKDDFNINPFRLDAVVRMRFSDYFGIYGRYSLTTMFETGKTQELYPFTIGFVFGGI